MHIGVDTGGTFTDIVAFDPATGHLGLHKVSSTPDNPALAVIEGVRHVLESHALKPTDLTTLIHGTTVATNAVLQGKWGKTALITTQGFRDVLEIGRQARPDLYDFFVQKPEPLVPRAWRFEVPERLDYQGNVLCPLDTTAVAELANALPEDVQSVAVTLLFSYLNPAHEHKVREVLAETSDLPIILSCETLPEFREYERTSTTVLNAALVPVVAAYLQALETDTRALGVRVGWRIMQSNAGIASAAFAQKMPVTLLLSGPAGGVEGARFVGAQTGHANLITLDMGGTSCDVSLIDAGKPKLSSEGEIAGRPVRVPMVDMQTIGAGGGSIAWIDPGRALRVGPQSAGAAPGPVCYGRGGELPTVTDAQLVLGRFNPETPLGDIPGLDLVGAQRAIETQIAGPLGMTLEEAAAGILAVADANMERAIRLISIERGYDPREFALLAFGGAGPLHGGRLAANLGIPTVIVPTAAGVLSAFGLLSADLTHTLIQTVLTRAETADWQKLNEVFAQLKSEAELRFREESIAPEAVTLRPSLDVRYLGQSFELNVPSPGLVLNPNDLNAIMAEFHRAHLTRYGYADETEPIELVNVRVTATCPVDKPAFSEQAPVDAAPEPTARRKVYFEQAGWVDCDIYARPTLQHSMALAGPAILEGDESTVVVHPTHRVRTTEHGHLIMEVPG